MPELLVQVLGSHLGPVLVGKAEHRAERQDDTDDDGVGAVADEERHGRGDEEQDQ